MDLVFFFSLLRDLGFVPGEEEIDQPTIHYATLVHYSTNGRPRQRQMDVLITLSFFHPQNKRNFKNHPSLFSATEERERLIASEREQLQADIERLTAEIEREEAARRSEREAFVKDIDAQVEEKTINREEEEGKESTWAVRREEAFRQDNELASKLAKWNLKPEAEVLTVSVSLKMLKHSFVFLFARSQCFSSVKLLIVQPINYIGGRIFFVCPFFPPLLLSTG